MLLGLDLVNGADLVCVCACGTSRARGGDEEFDRAVERSRGLTLIELRVSSGVIGGVGCLLRSESVEGRDRVLGRVFAASDTS